MKGFLALLVVALVVSSLFWGGSSVLLVVTSAKVVFHVGDKGLIPVPWSRVLGFFEGGGPVVVADPWTLLRFLPAVCRRFLVSDVVASAQPSG